MVAVNRANLLTRLWRYAPASLLNSEVFFYSAVRNMVQGDPVLFAAGNCYDAFMLVEMGGWEEGRSGFSEGVKGLSRVVRGYEVNCSSIQQRGIWYNVIRCY